MKHNQTATVVAIGLTGLSAIVLIFVATLFFSTSHDFLEPNRVESSRPSLEAPDASSKISASNRNDADFDEAILSNSEPSPPLRTYSQVLASGLPYLELPSTTTDVAFDHVHQQLLLIGGHQNNLAIYRVDEIGTADVQPNLIDLGGLPTAVGLKKLGDKLYYLVSTFEPTALVLIDAEQKKIIRRAEEPKPLRVIWDNLDGADRRIVMAPFLGNEERIKSGIVDQIDHGYRQAFEYDVEKMWFHDSITGLLYDVSSHGPNKKFLYRPENHDEQSVTLGQWKPGEQKGWIEDISTRSPWNSRIAPRFCGDLVGLKNVLVGQNLNQVLGTASFYPAAAMPQHGLVAGTDELTFGIGSIVKTVTRFETEFPSEWAVLRRDRNTEQVLGKQLRQSKTFADTKGPTDRFIVALPQHIVVVPLDLVGVKPEASLHLTMDVPPQVFATRQLEMELRGSPQLRKLELVKAPDGMRLEANRLVWTPTESQCGTHTIRLSHSFQEQKQEFEWPITVRHACMTLPIKIRGGELGEKEPSVFFGRNSDQSTNSVNNHSLVSVDLKKFEITNVVSIPSPDYLRLSDRLVLVSSQRQLHVFNRVTLDGPLSVPILPVKNLEILTRRQLLELESLLLDEKPNEALIAQKLAEPVVELNGPTGLGAFEDGVLYDESTKRPKLLVWAEGIRTGYYRSFGIDTSSPFCAATHSWHPFPVKMIDYRADQIIHAFRKGFLVHSPQRVELTMDDDRLMWQSFSIADGKPAKAMVLGKLELNEVIRPGQQLQTRMYVQKDRIVVSLNSHLYPIELASIPKFDPPFHIEPQQPVFILPASGPVELEYVAAGIDRLSLLLNPGPHAVQVQSATSYFKFTMRDFTPALIQDYVRESINNSQATGDNREKLKQRIERAHTAYRSIFGKPAPDVPVPVQARVSALSREGKRAYLLHDYLIMVPEEKLYHALEELKL